MNLENMFHIEATDCRDHRVVNQEAGTPGTKHTSMDNVNQFVFVTYTFCYSCAHVTRSVLQHFKLHLFQ